MKKLLAIVISVAMVIAMTPLGGVFATNGPVAKIGENTYTSLEEAVNAVETGGTITLVKSFSTEGQIEITDKEVTLDLNGNSLTKTNSESKTGSDLALIYVHSGSKEGTRGKVTIKDTKGEGKLISDYDNILYLDGGTIEQVSGTVESTGYWMYEEQAYGNTAVRVLGSESDCENYSKFIMGKDAVISSLKKTKDNENVGCGYVMIGPNDNRTAFGANIDIYGKIENAVLYINGQIREITGNVPNFNVYNTAVVNGGIYAAGYAKWNIKGANITGATGIEIRAGELIVSNNAKITGTSKPISVTPNGNGSTTDGAGIAVAQHNTKLPIDVKISSGNIKGFNALYESNPQNNSTTDINKVKIAVSGGNFTAINDGTNAVYSQDKNNFITGGTFSDLSALNYLGDNADITINLDKNITISDDTKKNTEGILLANKKVTINGGGNTITVAQTTDESKNASALNIVSGGNVTLNNLTIDGNNTAKHGINVFGGTATLENVTLKNFTGYGMVVQGNAEATNLTVTDCGWGGVNVDVNSYNNNSEFTLKSGNVQSVVVEHSKQGTDYTSKAAISGGTIGAACIYNGTEAVTELSGAELVITGGTFTSNPAAYLVGENKYAAVGDTNGTWTVKEVTTDGNTTVEVDSQSGKVTETTKDSSGNVVETVTTETSEDGGSIITKTTETEVVKVENTKQTGDNKTTETKTTTTENKTTGVTEKVENKTVTDTKNNKVTTTETTTKTDSKTNVVNTEENKTEVVKNTDSTVTTTVTNTTRVAEKVTGSGTENEKTKSEVVSAIVKTTKDGTVTSETKTVTAEADNGSKTTTTTKVSGTTAQAEVGITTAPTTGTNNTVTLTATTEDMETATEVKAVEVTINKDSAAKLKTAAENKTVTEVKVETSVGTLTISNKALKTLTNASTSTGEQAKLLVLTVENKNSEISETDTNVAAKIELKATVDDQEVFSSDNAAGNGQITVAIPMAAPESGKRFVAYYVNDGKRTYMGGTYNSATGTFSWVTNHFSDYEVVKETVTSGGGYVAPTTDTVVNSGDTTTDTVKPSTTTAADGTKTVTATVSAADAKSILDKAVSNKSKNVVINTAAVTETAAGTTTKVDLPEQTVKAIAEQTEAAVTIKTGAAEVTLDKEAVNAVAEQAGDTGYVSLVIKTVKNDENIVEIDMKLVTSKGDVTDFKGGNVAVTVKVNDKLATKELVCLYIDDTGKYHKIEGIKNDDGTFTFKTGQLLSIRYNAEDEDAQLDTLIKEVSLKVKTTKTSKKNIKVTVSGDITALTDAGYTVKYRFCRSTKASSSYDGKKTKDTASWTNTAGTKGTKYYYKAKVYVYDENGTKVGQTKLSQCKYSSRTWSKK